MCSTRRLRRPHEGDRDLPSFPPGACRRVAGEVPAMNLYQISHDADHLSNMIVESPFRYYQQPQRRNEQRETLLAMTADEAATPVWFNPDRIVMLVFLGRLK